MEISTTIPSDACNRWCVAVEMDDTKMCGVWGWGGAPASERFRGRICFPKFNSIADRTPIVFVWSAYDFSASFIKITFKNITHDSN